MNSIFRLWEHPKLTNSLSGIYYPTSIWTFQPQTSCIQALQIILFSIFQSHILHLSIYWSRLKQSCNFNAIPPYTFSFIRMVSPLLYNLRPYHYHYHIHNIIIVKERCWTSRENKDITNSWPAASTVRTTTWTTSDGQYKFSLQPQHHSDIMFSSLLCFCFIIKTNQSIFSFDTK